MTDYQKEETGLQKAIIDIREVVIPGLERQSEELRRIGGTTTETAALLRKAGERQDEYERQLEELKAERASSAALQKRLDALEANLARGGAGRAGARRAARTLGRAFVESAAFIEYSKEGGKRSGSFMLENAREIIANTRALALSGGLMKRDVYHGATEIGSMNAEETLETVLDPQRPRFLLDYIPTRDVTTADLRYSRESSFLAIVTLVASSVGATDTTITVDNAVAFRVGSTIYVNTTSQSAVIQSISGNVITLTGVTGFTAAVGIKVWSESFIATPEGSYAPQMQLITAEVTPTIKDFSSSATITRQQLRDSSEIEMVVNTRLMENLEAQREQQLLFGTGSNGELEGLMVVSGANTYLQSSGPATDTKLDALRRAMTAPRNYNFGRPTVTVLNNDDWEDIELLKGDGLRYLWATAPGEGSEDRAWRVPVVTSQAMTPLRFLTGNLQTAARYLAREEFELFIAEQHEGYAAQKKVGIFGNIAGGLQISYTRALTQGTFSAG